MNAHSSYRVAVSKVLHGRFCAVCESDPIYFPRLRVVVFISVIFIFKFSREDFNRIDPRGDIGERRSVLD